MRVGSAGTLSGDLPDAFAGVAGLLDQIDLPLASVKGGADGVVQVLQGALTGAGGLLQLPQRVVDGFAHRGQHAIPMRPSPLDMQAKLA